MRYSIADDLDPERDIGPDADPVLAYLDYLAACAKAQSAIWGSRCRTWDNGSNEPKTAAMSPYIDNPLCRPVLKS
jgi:hypothetical protein